MTDDSVALTEQQTERERLLDVHVRGRRSQRGGVVVWANRDDVEVLGRDGPEQHVECRELVEQRQGAERHVHDATFAKSGDVRGQGVAGPARDLGPEPAHTRAGAGSPSRMLAECGSR